MVDWGAQVREVLIEGAPGLDPDTGQLTVERDGAGLLVAVHSDTASFPLVACTPEIGLNTVLADLDVLDLLEAGLPAIVVVEAGQPTGHVPAQVLHEHLLDYLPDAGAMGPGTLDGDLQPPQALELTCTVCHTVNKVLVFVRGRTPCTQGHPLEVDWA